MKLFLDTNVIIASLTDEPERGETATELLNADHEFHTSLINIMELRTVLAKKKRIETDRVEEIEREVVRRVT
jgi:predicted nucleic acid-binding protein